MLRAICKGSIPFGSVDLPVSISAAVHEQHLLFHKNSLAIDYQRVGKKEHKPVPDSEIARAYEREDGTMVVLEDSDFEAAKAEGYHAITVLDFVPHDEIDPIYFGRTFYLGPRGDGVATHVYVLLTKAMERSGLSAVCSYIVHNREHLGCVRVNHDVLVLERMCFADEVRDPADARPAKGQRTKKQLVKALS